MMSQVHVQDSNAGRKTLCLQVEEMHTSTVGCFRVLFTPKDPCESTPCVYGAECLAVANDTDYRCICLTHYTGRNCETVIDPCKDNPCKNGGTCASYGLHAVCICKVGYTGSFCESLIDTCYPDPCHHGVCKQISDGFQCGCIDGYSGSSCNHTPSAHQDPCSGSTPKSTCRACQSCVVPNGMCTYLQNKPQCLCSFGYQSDGCLHEAVSTINKLKPRFVPPTLNPASVIFCDYDRFSHKVCSFALFVSGDGKTGVPVIHSSHGSSDLNVVTVTTPTVVTIPGITDTYRADVIVRQKNHVPKDDRICFSVYSKTDVSSPTDARCFNVRHDAKSLPLGFGYLKMASRFLPPTLPTNSEMICQVNTLCRFFVYTKAINVSSCYTVAALMPEKVKVFPPLRAGSDCMSEIVYDATNSTVGFESICLKSWKLAGGESRCFIMRLVISCAAPTSVSTTPVTVRSDIACNGDRISVFVPKNLLPAGQRVTWRDQDCSVSDNGTHYIGSVDFSNCGTTVQFTNDSVQFRNELISHNRRTGNSSIIDFGSEYDTVVPVECDYPKKANTMSSYLPIHERVQFVERRMGNLQLQMQQTADATFHDALPQDGSPRKVPINQDIFIKLSSTAANRSDVGIRVDNCVATPTASPADSTFQTLVDNGCPALDAVTRYDSPSDEARFGVRAFQFTSAPASLVYVHCQVSVCPTSDPQCVTSCTPSTRRRRSVQSGHESHLVSSGPYLLVAEQGSAQVATIVAAVCGLLAVVATTFAVIMWRKMRKNGNFKHVDE